MIDLLNQCRSSFHFIDEAGTFGCVSDIEVKEENGDVDMWHRATVWLKRVHPCSYNQIVFSLPILERHANNVKVVGLEPGTLEGERDEAFMYI
ncbi:hypothetical protein Tco_0822493 [Tanacetum coccineum]|uniref:Uncharacterized protein n=1 Tax=Tanacetum coccineum TaxID=301880 RepID=A0ABQ5AH26_9ASTR